MTDRLTYIKQNLKPIIVINDYDWFVANQTEVEKWVENRLPRGLAHIQGTTIEFDSDRDASDFYLRWGRWSITTIKFKMADGYWAKKSSI